MAFTAETEKYFSNLKKEIEKNYEIAKEARKKGLDPRDDVEVPLAMTMAAKVVRLIATIYPQLDREEIINRIIKLEEQYGALDNSVSLKIAEEIALQKYCSFKSQMEAMDAGIRVGFAYTTLGVVSSPIEGYTGIKTGKRLDGKDYIKAYFSGPIRSAGTTAGGIGVILIDYIRQIFGYERYDATEQEAKRTVTELYDYHERVNNLQYLPTEEEAYFIGKNLPIQVTGEPTEKREVSNYKNIGRIETDFIRGGFCLILGEGIAQKAKKILRLLKSMQKNGFNIKDWEWLEEYVELHEKREKGKTDASPTYIKDLVAGRPVFGHPGKGFRFRYGRSRAAGFSAVSVHPATMAVTNDFIATGTQLKVEKPTKGCVVTPCDLIEGPIVKFKNGSVKKLKNYDEAKMLYKEIEEIIYLGDILFPLGDVMNRNAVLITPGYVEEWWNLEVEKNNFKVEDFYNVDLKDAMKISQEFDVPLYPKYIYYWTEIDYEQFMAFADWFNHSRVSNGKLILPFNSSEKERFQKGKRAMELLGVEHDVHIENVILNEKETKALLLNLGVDVNFEGELDLSMKLKKITEANPEIEKDVLGLVNKLSKFKIKDKAGEFIGSRMGRPEKAKMRKLTGSPNVLFPVGDEGGRLRSVNEAVSVGSVKGDFPFYFCKKCNRESIFRVCEICSEKTEEKYYCRLCKRVMDSAQCPIHEKAQSFKESRIDIKHYFEKSRERLGLLKFEAPELIKGVRGTNSENHDLEHLEKGILRAKHNLTVNKDGTIRYDMTELPLTHFKPKEIEASVEKLRELGYVKDCNGNELVNENQILELMPHDILLPCNSLSGDEKADDVFMNISKFIDELLEKFYGLKKFYNLNKREDLIGHLGVCMAPHNCAGVICRIIGFSKVQGLLASPYMHAAIRRDCVHPNTNFVYSENNFIKNKKIGDYVERLIQEGSRTKKIDSFGTIRVELNKNEKDIFAFGINPKTKNLVKKKIKYFIKAMAPEKWIKIKTTTGREQIMTPRHKFVYLDNENNLKVKPAAEIKTGDKVALINNFKSANEIKEIYLPKFLAGNVPIDKQNEIRIVNAEDFFKKLVNRIGEKELRKILDIKGFNNLADWYGVVPLDQVNKLIEEKFINWDEIPKTAKIRTIFNPKEWDLNIKITEDLLWILGCYAAEGYSRQSKSVSQIAFRIMDKNQMKKLAKSVGSAFGLKVSFGEDKTKITICDKMVYYLFKYCFRTGSSAYEKRVPDIVFNVSENLVKNYLSAFFDGDGTIIYGNKRKCICFYSVSRELLDGISLLGCSFGLFGRFQKTKERLPGRKILERYKELNKEPKKHILNHLVYTGKDFYAFAKILKSVSKTKNAKIKSIVFKEAKERRINNSGKILNLGKVGDIYLDFIKSVEFIRDNKNSYCFEVDWNSEEEKNVLWGEQIINARCDGDEAALMLLMDVLINFSRSFLPSHRGGTQDAPLVLNGKISAKEVDDQILDLELVNNYPLEMYEKAEKKSHSSEIKIEMVKQRIGRDEDPYVNTGFTHDCSNFNQGATCSSYKTLPTMQDKVRAQMDLCVKLRGVDQGDVARLIIDRHFMKDLKGNLRKFSQQNFRCGKCNEIYRRPPLNGKCEHCGNPKLIFTISYGSIVKYLEPALDLINNFKVPAYIQQDLELTKKYIESIFGRDTEKQESIEKWF